MAVLYAREGADVAIVYLSEDDDAGETARRVEAEGRRALLIRGDVTDPEFCKEAVEQTIEEFGRLDILVNNAAFQQHVSTIEELSEEQFDHTFKTNIYGYFYMAKAAVPHLGKGAAIVNTGSDHRARWEAGRCSITRPPRVRSTPSPSRSPRTCWSAESG